MCAALPVAAYPQPISEDLAGTVPSWSSPTVASWRARWDVRNGVALSAVVDEAVSELGRLDAVVANAGICVLASWEEVTAEMWRDVLDTNPDWRRDTCRRPCRTRATTAVGRSCTRALPAGHGHAVLRAVRRRQHGLVGLGKSMANELGRHGDPGQRRAPHRLELRPSQRSFPDRRADRR